jgi:subtilisin family serine protease
MTDLRAFVSSYWQVEPTDRHLVLRPPAVETAGGSTDRIVLLDSGVLPRHPALAGTSVVCRDFTGSGLGADPGLHGTRNAAALVGRRLVTGLVPECELYVGRVLAGSGRAKSPEVSIAAGLDWARELGVGIIAMPFGRTCGSQRIQAAIRRTLGSGCRIFAAAGNRGPFDFLFPARLDGIVAVTGSAPDGSVLDWCCASQRIDILAPGLHVPAPSIDGVTTFSGSSIACVLAAGAAVLALRR